MLTVVYEKVRFFLLLVIFLLILWILHSGVRYAGFWRIEKVGDFLQRRRSAWLSSGWPIRTCPACRKHLTQIVSFLDFSGKFSYDVLKFASVESVCIVSNTNHSFVIFYPVQGCLFVYLCECGIISCIPTHLIVIISWMFFGCHVDMVLLVSIYALANRWEDTYWLPVKLCSLVFINIVHWLQQVDELFILTHYRTCQCISCVPGMGEKTLVFSLTDVKLRTRGLIWRKNIFVLFSCLHTSWGYCQLYCNDLSEILLESVLFILLNNQIL